MKEQIKKAAYVSAVMAVTWFANPYLAEAQIVPHDTNTSTYNAPNGVPVVDIAKTNAAGVSHNQFNNYNVDSRGVVLNNGNSSQLMRQSQLAGQVAANLKLTDEASVIINEVVMPNRSILAGFTEVLGHAADVVVANPYGVTCNGCGFINTPNVSLTTGVPQFNGGGALTGFQVNTGDILITGTGLNSADTDYLALIARSMVIEGQINAKALDVVAGANDWDYVNHTAAARAPTGVAPTLAIDSSALGGMYANRIRLIATEAGVGVRMLGEAAAGVDDFTINSAGQLVIGNKLSAHRDLSIASTASGSDAVHLQDKSLSATRNLSLTASTGEVHLEGGSLTAGNNLGIASLDLTDVATATAGADTNKRYAAGDLTLTQTGATSFNGVAYGAGDALTGSADTLAFDSTNGATLYGASLAYTTANAMLLRKGSLKTTGDLSLTATNDSITTDADTNIQSTGGNITVTAGDDFTNAGVITADNGDVTGRVDFDLNNTGSIHAHDVVDLADKTGGAGDSFSNSGTILADNTLSIQASDFTNTSNIQGTKGSTLTATDLNNSGTMILSDNTGFSGTITALTVTNTGTIQSKKDLDLDLYASLDNSSKILATGALTIAAQDSYNLLLNNLTGGTLQAGTTFGIEGLSGGHNVYFTNNAGMILGDTLSFNLLSLTNSNIIQGGTGASTISTSATLTNNAGGNIKLGTTSAGSGTINASTLNNAGTIESKGALALNAASGINNTATTAKIISDGNLTFRGLSAASYAVANNGLMQSTGGTFSIDGFGGAHAVTLTAPSANALYLGDSINFNVTSVSLAGSAAGLKATNGLTLAASSLTFGNTNNYIYAGGAGTININGNLSNNAAINAQGNLNLTADSITNTSTGGISSNAVLSVTADNGAISNSGALFGNTGLNATATSNFTNGTTGTVDSNGGGTITANTFTNYNDINYAGNLIIDATYFYNQVSSVPAIDWSYWGYGFDPNADSSSTWAVYGVCGKSGVPAVGGGDFCALSGGKSAARDAAGNNTFATSRTQIESEGFAWAGWNVWENTDTWYVEQSYNGSTTPITDRPLIRSNGSITIRDFVQGKNLGGVISASGALNVNGAGGGSTFENNALTIQRQYWIATWYDSYDEWIDGSRTAWYHPRNTSSGFYYNKRLDTSKGGGDGIEDIASVGATMHGGSVSITGTALSNVGSTDSNSSGASVDGTSAPTTGSGSSVGNTTTGNTTGANSVSFGGITITLPTNPNGFFVVSQNPNSTYLIETNPKFADPNMIGSDYMAKQYGLDINQLEKRLGDGAYEASLVRQQLISQLGTNLIETGSTEAQQMQKLMDNGVSTGKQLGLTYGKALTQEQVAGLKSDMVWMVDTVVNGQHVLAPVVYLAADTKAMFQSGGAVIAGNKVNMDVTSLANTGGTISGKENLNVTSKGDITNTSGTIKGGDVSLTSTLGNIVNETWNKFTGDDSNGGTSIGKTGKIESTGNLNLDAKKDITNKGADMTAGGNANLKAGDNITFDTIVDKKAKTTESTSGDLFTNSTTSTNEVTSKNIGSNLKVGGNLTTDSGKDTTIRGSNVDVKGDGDMHAGGNLNILDVQDEKHTTVTTSGSGIGVGGGVYGTQKDTDDLDTKTSVGSKLNFGGNAKLSADKDLTIQGSDVGAGGDLGLKGDSVNILEGRNEETHKHTTETTTFLSVGSSGSSDSGTDTSYNLSDEDKEAAKTDPDAGAGAHANASATGSADLSLAKTTKTETNEFTSRAKGSNIKSGGNMTVESNKDTTIRGSNVDAGGDVDVNAGGNLNIEAAEDKHTKNTKTTETSIGFHTSSENKADAGAQAGASADDGGAYANAKGSTHGAGADVNAGNANADADASASAEASSDNSLDLVRHTETETNTTDITHTKSTIKSGGNTKLKATNDINVKGSDVDAAGDLDVDAGKDLNVTAAEDKHETTSHSSKTSVGLYAEAGADTKVEGNAKAGAKTGAEGGVSGEANANAGIGLQGKNTTEDSVEGSTKAQTSSLKSGGNMSRKAGNKITDEGTQIEAGGDYTQDSKEWESKAAKDTTYSSKSSEMNKAKLGLYAEAGAEGHASAEGGIGKPQTDTGSEAGASAGLKASYERETKDESSSSSKAVTSSIKSGGKMKTTTTGKTSLEGTNLESGSDMEVDAGELDYKAARDTETSSKGGDKANGEIKVGVDATKAVTGSLKGGYETESESSSSSTAVVGSMKSGGKLKVNSKGDANFEGTNIESADDASVKSENGSVNFNAAHDTSESTSNKWNVEASISASKSKGSSGKGSTAMGLDAKGGMEHKTESEDNAVTGSIKSGGKLDVSAKKNVTLEGTAVESKGDTTLDAGENVDFKAAKSTKSSEEYGFEAELKATKGGKDEKTGKTKGTEGGLEAKGNYGKSDETTSTAGSMKSGGGIKVKSGKDTTFEGTNIESEGKTSVDAGGNVNFKAAEDKSTSVKVDAELDAKKEEGGKGGNIGGSVEGGMSKTKKTGSIKAGEIEVKSKGDTTLEGTKLDSKGDTTLDAGGNLNLNAAESSHVDGSIGGKVGSDGALLKDAGIGGGNSKEGVNMNTGGNLKLKSGGKTTMTGTKAKVEGTATIDAKGGEEENTAVSGGAQLGTSRAGADIDVQTTHIDAKGGVSKP